MNDLISEPLASDQPLSTQPTLRISAAAMHIILHPLALLLLAFFCNTLLWAFVVGPGRAPDEADHFDYVRHVALTHTLPIYGQTPRFNNPHALNSETQQPPLYYLLAVPFHLLVGGQTETQQYIASRLLSAVLGTIAVALSYALGRTLVPRRREFAMALAVIVGFNPMFTFMSAAISNDALINMAYPALLLAFCLLLRRRTIRWVWLLGLGALMGVGLLSKFSIVSGILASGIVLVTLAWRQSERRLRMLCLYCSWTACGLLLIAGWYIARNWWLYGDPTGVLVMGTYTVNPMWPYHRVGTFWQMITTSRPGVIDFWRGMFHGFWGVFDYYTFWMAPRVYLVLNALLAGGIIGTGKWAARAWQRRGERVIQERLTLATACCAITLITLGLILNYSFRIDYQPQGRYLLPALAPLALAIVVGWEQLLRLIKLQRLAAPLLIILMLSVNLLALFTTLAPGYHDRYLKTLASSPEMAAQPIAGAFEARATFVAQHARIEHLELLLDRPNSANGPLIWRLRRSGADADLGVAVEQKPVKGLGRYMIGVSQPVVAGQTYTLIVQAPWTTEDKHATAYVPERPIAGNELDLEVVYPLEYAGATLRRIDYLLRSSAPGWPRGNGQRLLYICTLPLMLALAARAFRMTFDGYWSWLAGISALLLLVMLLWAPPGQIGAAIPTRSVTIQSGPLITLDETGGSVADLILLSGSSQARKQPPDDPARHTSQIQPYRFTIGGDTRAVLAMQPPSAITYTLDLPLRARLQTAIALDPQVWQPDKGDGVEFVVLIGAANGHHELLRRYIDPKAQPADRRWHNLTIDLSTYAGQQVQLTLLTLPGPAGDGRYDWAGWAAPKILQKQ